MGTQDYRATYREAMHEATAQLNAIYHQFDQLQFRKEQIEVALTALQPFLSSNSTLHYEEQQFEPAQLESARVEPRYEVPAPEPVLAVSEPEAPAPFAPVSDVNLDPIQNRINRALGLAVA